MKCIFRIAVIMLVSVLSFVVSYAQQTENRTVTIGVVMDGQWDRNDAIYSVFRKEITDLLSREFDMRFPPEKTITGDWTPQGIDRALQTLLADPEVDIVLAGGLLVSAQACQYSELSKPVIAPFVLDADLQGLPVDNGASGVENLNYIVSSERFETDLETYHDIYAFTHPVMLVSSIVSGLYPSFQDDVEYKAREMGIDLHTIVVDTGIEPVLDALPEDTDAVIISALYPLPEIENKRLIQGLIDRKLPGFTGLFRGDVEKGIYAGRVPEGHFQRRARRVALNIQRILLGEDAGTLPVTMSINFRILINMKTARTIGVLPGFNILTEAELLNPRRDEVERKVNLTGAVREAVRVNLDLVAKQRAVAAGKQAITDARSVLLPQIEVSALQTVIDKDNAEKSMGQMAERTFSGSATLSQVLFSEPAWANYSIRKHIQKSLEEELETLRIDIARDAAIAYIDLLKGRTVENIQRENLKLIREHLEIAKIRQVVGISGPSDKYRLESEIAMSRKNLIEAISYRNALEINLNRILHRPVEEHFTTEETALADIQCLMSDKRILQYFRNPWSFRTLRRFFVEYGLRSSPELRTLDAAISAQSRALVSAKRSYYTPTLGLQGELANTFSRSGAGSEGGVIDVPNVGSFSFGKPEDDSWNLGIRLSLPVFEGGAKRSAHIRAREELRKLETDREAVAEKIEQNIRSTMHMAGFSYSGISLSRDAAEAAHKSLELVEDAYSQGLVSIIELLDARNAVLTADLAASNAEYNFIGDLVNVQRSIGTIPFLESDEECKVFIRELEAFFEKAQSDQTE